MHLANRSVRGPSLRNQFEGIALGRQYPAMRRRRYLLVRIQGWVSLTWAPKQLEG